MTKKRLFIFSGGASVILVLLNYIGTFSLCGGREYNACMDIIFDAMLILFPVIPLFLFSLITIKMREEIFQYWWKFARFLIPASMLTILISPSYTHNWMFPIEKGTVALASSAFFLIASLFIIAHKSLQSGKK
ncbi:MAG: hypothetical protein PHP62_01155 [Candidatus Moranbacteria bacterium]|nr:hypothetical protein [Candidatus Moranbacteria bacterium]